MRRLAILLAAAAVLLAAVAVPAAAHEKRRVLLASPGTAQDVSFVDDIGATRPFFTDESLVASDTDGGQADLYRRIGGHYFLLSKPTGVADPGTPVTDAAVLPNGSTVVF
ncbi:MAG: hypothetical protein ACJ760_03605, partial [Thermoleophilaceae bacterium]